MALCFQVHHFNTAMLYRNGEFIVICCKPKNMQAKSFRKLEVLYYRKLQNKNHQIKIGKRFEHQELNFNRLQKNWRLSIRRNLLIFHSLSIFTYFVMKLNNFICIAKRWRWSYFFYELAASLLSMATPLGQMRRGVNSRVALSWRRDTSEKLAHPLEHKKTTMHQKFPSSCFTSQSNKRP